MVQSIMGQLKSPKKWQSELCVMSLERVHKRVVISVGGVLGLRYARTRTVGSELFRHSQTMRLTNGGRGGVISCGQRLDFP